MSSAHGEVVTPNANGFEMAAPEDGDYSGAFLMDSIRQAKIALAEQGSRREADRYARIRLDPRLYDAESQEATYHELSAIPGEILKEIAKETTTERLTLALDTEHNARLDRIVDGLKDLVKQHYINRQLCVSRLPDIELQPISLHGTSYVPKSRQSVKGEIGPWDLPQNLIVATRRSRYNVQTHSHRKGFEPFVEITMLD